jgi:hypothetical protein
MSALRAVAVQPLEGALDLEVHDVRRQCTPVKVSCVSERIIMQQTSVQSCHRARRVGEQSLHAPLSCEAPQGPRGVRQEQLVAGVVARVLEHLLCQQVRLRSRVR